MASTINHQKLVHEILLDIGSRRDFRCWKNITGVGAVGGRIVRFGLVGAADISGIKAPSGQRFELEIKTGNAVQTAEQKSFGKMILNMGGIYAVVRSVEDARRALGLGENESFKSS